MSSRYAAAWRVLRDGPAPLLPPDPDAAERTPLHVAVVLPSLPVGSGGHTTVVEVVLGLERRGHTCSIWVLDGAHAPRLEWPGALRRKLREHYGPVAAPVFRGLGDWYGADVALATSWETAYAVATLPGCRARAYLLNDHESEFHPTSVERELAERSYGLGLHGIAGSPWLADVYGEYGGTTSTFDYGVDRAVYRPGPGPRRPDTVVFYARATTPRRGVPLGIAALEELAGRRPNLHVVAIGNDAPFEARFAVEHAGVVAPARLAEFYSTGTAGLCLSMTNYSLIPHEMLACGLPAVELDRPSTRSVYAPGGPVALAPFHPVALADELERLLSDEEEWARRSEEGLALVAERTWDRAAAGVEAGLKDALRR